MNNVSWTVGSNSAASCRLFRVWKGLVQHLSSNVLSLKLVIRKILTKLKDHSSVTDDRANGIPFKDKGSKSLKTHFVQDVTSLDNNVHPPEEGKHKKERKFHVIATS